MMDHYLVVQKPISGPGRAAQLPAQPQHHIRVYHAWTTHSNVDDGKSETQTLSKHYHKRRCFQFAHTLVGQHCRSVNAQDEGENIYDCQSSSRATSLPEDRAVLH